MRKLNLKSRYDAHSKMSDIRFLEEEIKVWLVSEERKLQILAERYYAGKHDILQRIRKTLNKDGDLVPNDKLPNNRIVDNQFAIHVDKKANYILGKPLTFSSGNDEYTKKLNKVFGPRAMRTFWMVGHGATLCGLHWVYAYIKDDEMRFASFPASEIMPEWADAEHTELDCAVRFFTVEEYDENGNKIDVHKVQVFDGNGITPFIWDGELKPDYDTPTEPYITVTEPSGAVQGYNWDRLPLVPFKGNREEQSILCRVKCIQDAYNLLLSDFANGMESSPFNTILVIKNAMGEDLGNLVEKIYKNGGVLVGTNFQGVESGVDTIEIKVNAENYKTILELLKKAIIENMRSFDAKDERMSGNPNQMNIQSVYSEIDIDANAMETEFQASFEDLLWFVDKFLDNKGEGDYEDEPVEVIFNRDILINEKESIENCIASMNILSEQTVIEQHPWTKDVQKEMERRKAEQAEQKEAADPYNNSFNQKNEGGALNE